MATYRLFPHDHELDLPIILEPDHGAHSHSHHRPMVKEQLLNPEPRPQPEAEPTTPQPFENDDTMKEVTVQVPTHPIPSMQGAFAESMLEANNEEESEPKNLPGTAAARRKLLIDQDVSEETHAARWKKKQGQQYHQLWKLMAQISFGIYLLLNGIAKDDEQVMNILQTHVDDVDEFLETTLEDFDLAQEDIDERLKFLKLPLENIDIFDAMLEDRNFRSQIVDGNERIEHVITRTATLMNDALKDVQQGLDACKEFTIYLAEEQEDAIWKEDRPDMQKVFDAMKGNVEGWYKAYVSLQTKGHHLGVALVQLGSIVAEMDKRAAVISKKFSTSPVDSAMATSPVSPPTSRLMRQSMSKNLPSDPNMITPAIRATIPSFQLMGDRVRTPEPEAEPERRDSASSDEIEPDFILKPRTYTPIPSPKPPTASAPVQKHQEPPPEAGKRSSFRKRFSLGKSNNSPPQVTPVQPSEDGNWGPRQRIVSIPAGPSRERYREKERESMAIREEPRDSTLYTPPSRGLDSAYCSDFDSKPSPPGNHPALAPTISHQSPRESTRRSATAPLEAPSIFTREFIQTPRSDQQHFRPVHASPNSPLQRPWTAGPANPLHMHTNSSTSNLSSLRGNGQSSRLGNRRGAPSTMGMSMMSDMTTVTNADGKKVKKKRSAFGWLKKAFSLSEEEKAAFEERRRMADRDARLAAEAYQRPAQKKWVDGKRVQSRG